MLYQTHQYAHKFSMLKSKRRLEAKAYFDQKHTLILDMILHPLFAQAFSFIFVAGTYDSYLANLPFSFFNSI